uniref:ABC transporter domain-containing protein n=1 Tax=Physcomitrium patens TaxID=3218 RepID=A0A2K1L1U5_PHYPA|nr:hypothetical protein PHYPA_002797 [Physcomitrium patens]
MPQAIMSEEDLAMKEAAKAGTSLDTESSLEYRSTSRRAAVRPQKTTSKREGQLSRSRCSSNSNRNMVVPQAARGMVLPFEPLSISFKCINYYVDMPPEMKHEGVKETKLKLLSNITGSFRPGVLTALVGVSRAGKTTLMDVLAGRKTSGYVEGDIRISGYPKVQETFARISGYCEQNDIHSLNSTCGRTVVCTIHQPSIDIFEAFDELLLLKRGGRVIYNGPLGHNSEKLIEYFQAIPGVTKIKEGYNPATWMLEVTNRIEDQLSGLRGALLDILPLPPQRATCRGAQNSITRFKRFVLQNAVLAKLFQPAQDHLVEAIYHVLAQSGLQPRTLYLYVGNRVDFGQLVLSGWNQKVRSYAQTPDPKFQYLLLVAVVFSINLPN